MKTILLPNRMYFASETIRSGDRRTHATRCRRYCCGTGLDVCSGDRSRTRDRSRPQIKTSSWRTQTTWKTGVGDGVDRQFDRVEVSLVVPLVLVPRAGGLFLSYRWQ